MNLLTEPLIRFETKDRAERGTLPQVYAALVLDRVESFPALRPHQVPAWHMFLTQLGAIAMHRAGMAVPPHDAGTWQRIIRELTRQEFPSDEPWNLVVEDLTKPGFLQPPVPEGVKLEAEKATPDELDMVITAKNHDLKQAVAADASPDDWIFALVSLQTCEGYGGGAGGLQGIARMNKGSSSRSLLALVPMASAAGDATFLRFGRRLRRDLTQLVARRGELMERFPLGYPATGGRGLVWTAPWPDGAPLALTELDIWFIEACRRVRLGRLDLGISAQAGTSRGRRINAEHLNGVVGDPWAPVHKVESKALTLGQDGEFDLLAPMSRHAPPLFTTVHFPVPSSCAGLCLCRLLLSCGLCLKHSAPARSRISFSAPVRRAIHWPQKWRQA